MSEEIEEFVERHRIYRHGLNDGIEQNKKEMVLRWRRFNPEGRKIDCQRETGLSKPTVLKWWNEADEQGS